MPGYTPDINVFHELNLNGPVQEYNNERFYCLQARVQCGGVDVVSPVKINNYLNIYTCEIDRYANNDPLIKKFFLAGFFRQNDIEKFGSEKIYPFYHLMADEKDIIYKIFELKTKSPLKQEITQHTFGAVYNRYTAEITEILDMRIKESFLAEVKKIFLKAIDNDEDKREFNLANFLMYYINWENSFYNFYESALDLIHAPLKNLENRFDNTFRVQLKAFLAYHSKVKVLQRFLEKRELGKITAITYLDWITEIKDFLLVEFDKIFGRQKAIEYILSLDMLLKSSLDEKND